MSSIKCQQAMHKIAEDPNSVERWIEQNAANPLIDTVAPIFGGNAADWKKHYANNRLAWNLGGLGVGALGLTALGNLLFADDDDDDGKKRKRDFGSTLSRWILPIGGLLGAGYLWNKYGQPLVDNYTKASQKAKETADITNKWVKRGDRLVESMWNTAKRYSGPFGYYRWLDDAAEYSGLKTVGRHIDNGLGTAGRWLGDKVYDVATRIPGAAENIMSGANTAYQRTLGDAGRWAGDKFYDAANSIPGVVEDAKKALSETGQGLKLYGEDAVNGAKNVVGGVADSVKKTVGDARNALSETLQGIKLLWGDAERRRLGNIKPIKLDTKTTWKSKR